MDKERIIIWKLGFFYRKIYKVKVSFECVADFCSTKCGVKVGFFCCPNIRGPPLINLNKNSD
jgi:hypothetical protein